LVPFDEGEGIADLAAAISRSLKRGLASMATWELIRRLIGHAIDQRRVSVPLVADRRLALSAVT